MEKRSGENDKDKVFPYKSRSEWCLQSRAGRHYSLHTESSTHLGRRNCDITLASRSVDREHAVISFDDKINKFLLKDLDSKNGTFLNDHKVGPDISAVLEHSDNLRFGLDPASFTVVRMNSEDSLNQDTSGSSEVPASLKTQKESVDTMQQGPDIQESPRSEHSFSAPEIPMAETPPHPHISPQPPEEIIPSPPPPTFPEESRIEAAHSGQFNRILPPVIVDTSLSGHQVRMVQPVSSSAEHINVQFHGNTSGVPSSMAPTNVLPTAPPVLFSNPAQHGISNPQLLPSSGAAHGQAPPVPTYHQAAPHHPGGHQQVFYQPVFVPGAYYYSNHPGGPVPPGATYIINAAAAQPSLCQHHHHLAATAAPVPVCPHCPPPHVGSSATEGHPSPPITVRTLSMDSPRDYSRFSSPPPPSTVSAPSGGLAAGNQQMPPLDPAARMDVIGREVQGGFIERPDSPPMRERQISAADTANSDESRNTQRYHTGAKMEKEHGRTPIFGHTPTWWGGDEPEHDQPLSEAPVRRRPEIPFRKQISCASDTEAMGRRAPSPPLAGSQRPLSYREPPVKMIIPLDDDLDRKVHRKPKSESTAFTIEFTDDSSSTKITKLKKPPQPPPDTDQTPADRQPFVRRYVRRSLGPMPSHEKPPTAPHRGRKSMGPPVGSQAGGVPSVERVKDPKEYLLSKLLSADPVTAENPQHLDHELPDPVEQRNLHASPRYTRKDSDAISDAGTYVIDREQEINDRKAEEREEEEARRNIDKVFGLVEEDEGRAESGSRTPTPPLVEIEVTPREGEESKNKEPPPVPQQKTNKKEDYFRTDGGRFSMRSPAVGRKLQVAPPPASSSDQAKKTEMTAAWLRRKQYDPRKQAAAGSTKKATPTDNDISTASEPAYLSNKSRSFHHGEMEDQRMSVAKGLLGSRKAPRNCSEENFKERGPARGGAPIKKTAGSESRVADFSRSMAAELAQMSAADTSNGNNEEEEKRERDLQAVLDKENYTKLMHLSDQLGNRTKRALDIIQSQSMSASVEELVSVASAMSEPELPSSRTRATQNLTLDALISQMQQASEAFNAVNKYLTEVCSSRGSNDSDGGDMTF